MATRQVYFNTNTMGQSSPTYTSLLFSDGQDNNGSAEMYADAYISFDDEGNSNPTMYVKAFLIGHNIKSKNQAETKTKNQYLGLRFTVTVYNTETWDVIGEKVFNNYQINPSTTNWSSNQTFSYNQGRTGEYGVPSSVGNLSSGTDKALFMGGSIGYTAIPLNAQGCNAQVSFSVEYQYYYDRDWFSGYLDGPDFTCYLPKRLTITPPSNVYVNGVNQFSATIEARYTSELTMQLSGKVNGTNAGIAGIDQPVRSVNAPYPTSGTTTSVIYWNGNIRNYSTPYTDIKYYLNVFLTITDPSNSNFKIVVANTTIQGTATYRETEDLSAYTLNLSISDLSGYYNQFGVLLRGAGSVIRAAYSVGLKYGATAQIYIKRFRSTSWTLVESYPGSSSGGSGNYDQYVPEAVYNASTECVIQAGGTYISTATFSASIVDYAAPTFSDLSVHRCNEDGTANDNGDHVRIEWGILVSDINNQNAKSLTINHPEGSTSPTLTSYTQTGELIVAANPDYSYEISFKLSDSIYNGSTAIVRTITLSTAGVIMDWLYGGKGVSFGKVAEIENAIEISPLWDLIAYKMLLGDVNVVNWIKEIASRMDAIEQFASNTGSTTQFQVTFYNGSEILKREWVLKNNDAIPPSEDPVRESSETTSYSFAGWALTSGATSADPNALTNITAYRSIYAAYTELTRYYTVRFCNGDTVLATFEQPYHTNPPYNSYKNLSPTPPTGGTFVGWSPSGQYLEENTKAQPVFYFDEEITDSWAEIVAACADGSYKEKYQPGNWKMLDLGTEGEIKMRIKGLNLHRMAGQNKAPISWEADNSLATTKAMNTAATKVYEEDVVDGFTFDKVEPMYFYYKYAYYYKLSKNADSSTNQARMTLVVTATLSVTVDVGYLTPSGAPTGIITAYKNGEKVVDGQSMTGSGPMELTATQLTLSAGDSVTYVVEAYAANMADTVPEIAIIEYTDPSRYQSVITISATIEKVDACIGYEGGAIGGFAKSQLHSYLQTTIKPLFPEALRLGLKKMRLIQSSLKSKEESPNYEYVENDWLETDLFIPSSEEILGNYVGNTKGVNIDYMATEYRKKENTGTYSNYAYWCRDVYPYGVSNYSTVQGSGSDVTNISRNYLDCTNSRRVYICFCT